MTNDSIDHPLLSLVLPTMGKGKNLFRCLDSIVHNAPGELLANTELIVFVNSDPRAPTDFSTIASYIATFQRRFHSTRIERAERYEKTAEESGYAACAHATGKFLWLVGDARIFLPEGLSQLSDWLREPTAPAAFFNTVWYEQDGCTEAQPSIHMMSSQSILSYKQFVMRTGLNFMATAMGGWVYERHYLDRAKWKYVIDQCGPHFSHVTTLLATMAETLVQCFSTFLYINESKAYHSGDDREWAGYSRLAGTYRFYAWTLGLVRQFNYLIEQGAYNFADVRRSMCSQGHLLRRQIDEVYTHLLAQIRYGWVKENERLTSEEFEEVMQFLLRACPEKVIVNGMISDIYAQRSALSDKQFMKQFLAIQKANQVDDGEVRLASLVVSQIGDQLIRLHPDGYIASRARDSKHFSLGYKLLDAPLNTPKWRVLTEAEFRSFTVDKPVQRENQLYPVREKTAARRTYLTRVGSGIVKRLYRYRLTYRVISLIPGNIKSRFKSALM